MQEINIDATVLQQLASQIVASNLVGPYLQLRNEGRAKDECLVEVVKAYTDLGESV